MQYNPRTASACLPVHLPTSRGRIEIPTCREPARGATSSLPMALGQSAVYAAKADAVCRVPRVACPPVPEQNREWQRTVLAGATFATASLLSRLIGVIR